MIEIFSNVPLWAAVTGIFFAQFIKIPIHFALTKKLDWTLFTSTGSMPSSHSAAVSALTVALGLQYGFNSPFFALSAIFAVIVMFDATGIRYQAGQQAIIINQMRSDVQQFITGAKDWPQKDEQEKRQELKTLLGHKPSEVFAGAVTGSMIAILFYTFFP